MQGQPEDDEHGRHSGGAEQAEGLDDRVGQVDADEGDDEPEHGGDDERVAHRLREHAADRQPPARRNIQDREGDGREDDELQEDHRRDEGGVADDVGGNGQADVVGVDVAGGERADRERGRPATPQEAREQHEREHARERGDRRDRQEGREQFREVGLGHDAEQERGQEDEEGGPPEDDGGGRPEHSEAAHDVADGDHRPDDREADEHARHRPSLV